MTQLGEHGGVVDGSVTTATSIVLAAAQARATNVDVSIAPPGCSRVLPRYCANRYRLTTLKCRSWGCARRPGSMCAGTSRQDGMPACTFGCSVLTSVQHLKSCIGANVRDH
jgi:hypothetical protein